MSKLKLPATTSLTRALSREEVERRFREKPNRLLAALGIQVARVSGVCCCASDCSSGRGAHGTGMKPFMSDHGNLRFFCYACNASYTPYDLVSQVKGCSFHQAACFLEKLYQSEHDERDDAGLVRTDRLLAKRPKAPLQDSPELALNFRKSVLYAQSCHDWRHAQAAALGLPDSALLRPDIGKAFVPQLCSYGDHVEDDDGNDPKSGDLVFFSLLDGVVKTIKVRHEPKAAGGYYVNWYDQENDRFSRSFIREYARTFRMCGEANNICFGLDSITRDTDSVIITEGQTDSLAACSAMQECGLGNVTAIARDSASHVLSEHDLRALAGKHVVYCEDGDAPGRDKTQINLANLKQNSQSVRLFSPADFGVKDIRALYSNIGASALVDALLTTQITK